MGTCLSDSKKGDLCAAAGRISPGPGKHDHNECRHGLTKRLTRFLEGFKGLGNRRFKVFEVGSDIVQIESKGTMIPKNRYRGLDTVVIWIVGMIRLLNGLFDGRDIKQPTGIWVTNPLLADLSNFGSCGFRF